MKSLLFAALATTLAIYAFAAPAAELSLDNKNYITCTICKDLVGLVDNAILGNSTIGQIEDQLDQFCDLLPNLVTDLCHDFVHNNLEGIIDSIVNEYLDPEELCTSLSACP